MSLTLPPRPSLDHLKKQAKSRLRELQASAPGARLADAQHGLARDYGFASWPRLRAHVESLVDADHGPVAEPAPTPSGPTVPPAGGGSAAASGAAGSGGVFHRFTQRAKRTLFFSRHEAAQLGSPTIEGEHLLLGVMRERQGMSPTFGPVAELRADVTRRATVGEELATTVIIPFGMNVKRAIDAAVEEADRLHQERIGTAHLLAGLLRQPSLAAEMLRDRGVDLSEALAELRRAPGDE